MNKILTYYLYPSALFADNRPHEVITILGTCVAVCLYDPVLKIGGINHYMLPFWNGEGLPSPKYGNIAIEKLQEKMICLGSQKKDLQAKIFGGLGKSTTANVLNIGQRNCKLAKVMLKQMQIPIVASHLGGDLARKLKFYTHTGEVHMKFVKSDDIV
jgi:chemotaxis protein CheD